MYPMNEQASRVADDQTIIDGVTAHEGGFFGSAASTQDTRNWDFPDGSGLSTGFRYGLGSDDSFISQVWQKTLGGKLKFIFQADGNRYTPDQFMIAKFKNDSLEIVRTSPTTHQISIEIEEVW